MNELNIFNSAEAAAGEAAKQFGEIVKESLAREQYFFTALSGGNTPKLLFKILAGSPYKENINWDRIHFFWADERMVPPDDSESNFGEAKKIFFDRIPISLKNIHYIKGDSDPQQEVFRYASDIENYVKKDEQGFPRFDLIFLGMGEDGHTGSLFPGKKLNFTDDKNICGLSEHPSNGHLRITLTKETINNSGKIIFLVTGESKAAVLSEILKNSVESKRFPAAQISSANGSIKWIIDKDAAKFIKK